MRIYSDYLYTFNSTHVTKYSLFSMIPHKLYTYLLEIRLGNPLQFIRNVNQYMLMVYLFSYKILNLQGQLLQLVIDDRPIDQKNKYMNKNYIVNKFKQNSVGNAGIYDMIIFGAGTLLLGMNNIMRAYDRNLQLTIGPYVIQQGRIRTHHSI